MSSGIFFLFTRPQIFVAENDFYMTKPNARNSFLEVHERVDITLNPHLGINFFLRTRKLGLRLNVVVEPHTGCLPKPQILFPRVFPEFSPSFHPNSLREILAKQEFEYHKKTLKKSKYDATLYIFQHVIYQG